MHMNGKKGIVLKKTIFVTLFPSEKSKTNAYQQTTTLVVDVFVVSYKIKVYYLMGSLKVQLLRRGKHETISPCIYVRICTKCT